MRFRDLSIQRRMLLSSVAVLLLTMMPLGISLWGLWSFNLRLDYVVETKTEAVKQSARLHRNIFELRTQEKEAILADTQEDRSVALARIERIRGEVEERYRAVQGLENRGEAAVMVAEFRIAYDKYDEALAQILAITAAEKPEEAKAFSRLAGREAGEAAAAVAVRYTQFQDAELDAEKQAADADFARMVTLAIFLASLALLLGVVISVVTARAVAGSVGRIVVATDSIAAGDLNTSIDTSAKDELGTLALAVSRMQASLRGAAKESQDQDRLKSGLARINQLVLGQTDPELLSSTVVAEVAAYLNAKVGALYVMSDTHEGPELRLQGSYAFTVRKNLATRFRLGEGLVGQAALERKQILLQNVPEDYVRVVSGLGDTSPRNICVTPFVFEGSVRGVLEIGTLEPMAGLDLTYLESAMGIVATAFEILSAQAIVKAQQEELQTSNEELKAQTRALEKSQEELRAQQAELENSNSELEMQMLRVKESEDRLRVQQEELEVTNEELREKNRLLERQRLEMELARAALATQAEDLALASKYKSEFLANMSHELRTPLNSLLLLARGLRDNGEGNLNQEQVESARVIFDSGSDLLTLINEILDLSKIEAGRMELHLESLELAAISRSLASQFQPMATAQGLGFEVRSEEGAPERIITDPQRLGQVLKNLIGNALKFTETGKVKVSFAAVATGVDLSRSGLVPSKALAIHVEDSGIGIPLDKQKVIFEAFQQADSGDRRRYGGTGLGLSISRELARLLGGEIQLTSEPGRGSTFSVFLPLEVLAKPSETSPAGAAQPPTPPKSLSRPQPPRPPTPTAVPAPPKGPSVEDDRGAMGDDDHSMLVVEDDARFARILADHVRKRGFKCLVALTGEEGLELARAFHPDGVILDIGLPGMDGWGVLNALKQDVDTRHIPVHIVSAADPSSEGLRIGAIGHSSKPIQAEDIEAVLQRLEAANAQADKLVLVVEDDPAMRRETVRIIGNGNVKVLEAATGREALEALRSRTFDLIVLDLGLPDMPGLDLLKILAVEKPSLPPVIIHTVRELTPDEEATLRIHADSIILKDVRSQERLIDEVALFLHRVVNDLPEDKRRAIKRLHDTDEPLRGRKVLIVEDDMRTMFAMTKLLASHGVNPLKAENGEKALAVLAAQPDVDLVLMDMMMPVMDGYEALKRVRAEQRFANLPIIALTAKAMKEDRQKCLNAGASDYLSKPLDPDRLVSLMRVWLGR
jgi:CheY-like chemotaxis protein